MKPKEFEADVKNDWCAGCGDFGILRAMEKAFSELGLAPHQLAVFGGIGCSGKTPYYLDVPGIHTLHGRVIPFATGAKLANPALTVIAVGGDGDGLGIGAGHLVNAGRRNLDLTYLLFNNEVYGLTKGQAAPTIRFGEKTKAMPRASLQKHINPVMLALSSGYTWVGRGYAYYQEQLTGLIQAAIRHRGSAFLEILQVCPVYNDIHDKHWYEHAGENQQARLYSLSDEGFDPCIPEQADDKAHQEKYMQCVQKAQEWGERIPLGVFYQDLSSPEFTKQINQQSVAYYARPPAKQLLPEQSKPTVDMQSLVGKFIL